MRISFDLDEVLFVDPASFETEDPLPFPLNRIFPERLRRGTVSLIRELQKQGFEVWVYTSSYRSEAYIRALFRRYNVRFDQIVNAPRHRREVQGARAAMLPQKVPSHYHISLHIDDEDAIHRSARQMGVHTLRVCEPDPDWAGKVLAEADRIRKLEEKRK